MKLPFHVDLSGHVALVTGGSGVLCSKMAQALALCGAKVGVLSRSLERSRAVTDVIGENALPLAGDVLSLEDMQNVRDQLLAAYSKITILVNGAGGNSPKATTKDEAYSPDLAGAGDFFSLVPGDISKVFDLNYLGTLLPVQVFGQDLATQPGSSIINISSMAAYAPMTKVFAYAGAKAAINNLTQWLATHFAGTGPRVNAIAPGFFVTEQNRALLMDEDGQPTPRTRKILSATPMGRFGEAEELIGALLYLASPQASGFVTGTVLQVDGGFLAYSGV